MNKRVTTVVASLFLFAALVVPASAQNVNEASAKGQDSNTYQDNSYNNNANAIRANATDNDNDMDWGWLGLLGLLGLAGMRKKVTDHPNR
ncbi:WGxxGxxG family protein [Paenibacillus sp. QZ-Y1]|uniref:WGxxGxxG family protein n=1 Tax=Paenibacillus sp. QZ-Y1 TaxID=3414511 RepID=UPI003F78B2DB